MGTTTTPQSSASSSVNTGIDPRDVDTPDDWVPRDPKLIRLTGRHPFNCEPPLEQLRTFITPTSVHYVRNHGAVPRLDWDSHRLQVDGLVDRPLEFSPQELLDTFKSHVMSMPVLLVCAGNRRKELNMIKKSQGFNWGAGGASTVVWMGIPLYVLLAHCGVDHLKARFVWFEGADVLPKGDYGTCIPAGTALDPSCDVLVAWKMDGELLRPDHGFPLRIIVPGHIGGRMVKWLARIHVSERESDNPYHLHDNRVLPSNVDSERAEAENWWVKPEYVIQELNVNSVLLSPAHMEELNLNNVSNDDSSYKVSGYAYSGGGRRIIHVEVTLDDGATWDNCRIIYKEKPNAYGKMWCWVHYELEIPVQKLVQATEICVRAWDSSMNTQPEFPTWNVVGMMDNAWFRVKIRTDGPKEFHFEHPTQVGGKQEGWMAPGKGQTRPAFMKSDSLDGPEHEQPEPVDTTNKQPPHPANLPEISEEEVAKHNTKDSCWFICRGLVYDPSEFLQSHPGGASAILLNSGTDATDEFEAIHSAKAWKMAEKYCIGVLKLKDGAVTESTPQASTATSDTQKSSESSDQDGKTSSPPVALNGKRMPLVLISKQEVSHDSRIFRFALSAKELRLGLPVGNHVFLYGNVNGKTVVRPYTPISTNDEQDAGFVSFLIKIYFAGENRVHPEGGVFSQYLDNLHLGSRIEMKGPLGHFTYLSHGDFSLQGKSAKMHASKFGFIAGGTGITPIYQVMRAILTSPADDTKVALIYCVRTADDLLLREELEQLQRLKPDNCTLFFALTDMGEKEKAEFLKKTPSSSASSYGTTLISLEMIERVINTDASHVGMCGPPGMIEHACIPALTKLGGSSAALVNPVPSVSEPTHLTSHVPSTAKRSSKRKSHSLVRSFRNLQSRHSLESLRPPRAKRLPLERTKEPCLTPARCGLLSFQSYWEHAGAGLLLLLAAVFVGQWAFEQLVSSSSKKHAQPQLRPKGTLPVFYNTFHAVKHGHRWADWITEQVEVFDGKPFLLRILGNPDMLVLSTPEQFEDVLKTHFDAFEKGPFKISIFRGLLGAGIFAADGKQWAHQRKTASNLFSLRALRESMTESIQRHALVLNGILERTAASKQPIDVFKLMNRFTIDTFAEIGFGVALGTLEATEDHPFAVAFDSAQRIIVLRMLRPSWFWRTQRLLNIGVEREFKQHIRVIDDLVLKIIAQALENRASQSQQHGPRKKDIVSLFLDNVSADADSAAQANDAFDPVYLRDIVVNFLIAGRDTTAQMLSWFFYLLSQHPHVETKIRDELASKLPELYQGKVSTPSMEQTGELVYLEAALRETMRLHPAVPRNSRSANRDVTLHDGTFVRKGQTVSVSSYVLGRMTRVWGDDAREYKPERWIDPQSGKLIHASPFKFPAFHAGPRTCLGMNLAMVEMKVIAAMVLSKFHLVLVPGQTITDDLALTHPIKGALVMNVLSVVK